MEGCPYQIILWFQLVMSGLAALSYFLITILDDHVSTGLMHIMSLPGLSKIFKMTPKDLIYLPVHLL